MNKGLYKIFLIDISAEERVDLTKLLDRTAKIEYFFLEDESDLRGFDENFESAPDCLIFAYRFAEPHSRELLEKLKANNSAPEIPIILLSTAEDEKSAAHEIGGSVADYLVKGAFSPEKLYLTIEKNVELFELRRYGKFSGDVPDRYLLQNVLNRDAGKSGEIDLQTFRKRLSSVMARARVAEFESDVKKAEAELMESKRLIGHLVEIIPSVVYVRDLRKRENIFVNRNVSDALGYTPEEILALGKDFAEVVIHPDDYARIPEREGKFENLADDEIVEFEYRMRHKSGDWYWFLSRDAVLTRDENGEPLQVIGSATDITRYKRAEELLSEGEERFRLLTENLDNVFWILDWRSKCSEFVSKAFNRLYGDDYADSLAVKFKNWTDIIHPEDRENAEKAFFSIEQSGKYESTYRIVLPDGTIRWRHAKGSPIRGENGEILRVVGVTEDITDRKKAEQRIRQSEMRLRMATDTAEMFSWETDLNEGTVKWSENAAKIIGCQPDELPEDIGKAMFFVRFDERERLGKFFEEDLRGEKNSYVTEFAGIGGRFWQAHGLIVRDSNGNPAKVLGVTQDITARKRAEERIQTANYRFRLAEEAAKGFNYEWNLETGVVTRSESVERVIGYRRDELEKNWQMWHDLMHPDDALVNSEAEAVAFLSSLTEETFSGEYRVRHKNGHYIWVMERGLIVRGEDGSVGRVIGQTIDISERREAEEKLLEAERRAVRDYRKLLARIAPLAQTLGTAGDLITIYRELLEFIRQETPCEGFFVSFYEEESRLKRVKYVWTNGAELDADELQPIPLFQNDGANSRAIKTGKSVITTRYLDKMNGAFQVIGKDDRSKPTYSLVTPMIVMGRTIGTLEIQNHENEYVQEHIVALEMAANLAAAAIENVRLMNIEAEARAAAEEANRAKDEFLAVLSHELRTPLNSIKGWITMLQNQNLDEQKRARAIEVIARNVNSQNALIEDILDVSRIISGKMRIETERISFVSLLNNVLDAIRPVTEKKGIDLVVGIDENADEMEGDSFRLQQIITNLLNNAIKFTPAQGEIKVNLTRENDTARLIVADNGIGIAPELLAHIFERFQQADRTSRRQFGGLGLGLAIVRNLTELHGGRIIAASEGEGKGAAFTVELPLISQFVLDFNEARQLQTANTKYKENAVLENLKLLVVDDDTDTLEMMRVALEHFGASVVSVNSARRALEELTRENFDLLISDVGMADMDGYDLIRHLRENLKIDSETLPAIALSGYVSIDDRNRAVTAGFQTHLGKPVDLEILLEIILELVKK